MCYWQRADTLLTKVLACAGPSFNFVIVLNALQMADTIFRKGLAIEPENAHLLHAMGLLEYKKGSFPVARDMFRRCTEVCPFRELIGRDVCSLCSELLYQCCELSFLDFWFRRRACLYWDYSSGECVLLYLDCKYVVYIFSVCGLRAL